MGDKTQADQPGGQHAMLRQLRQQGGSMTPCDIDKHDVGLRRAHRQGVNARQALGQPLRQRMVLRQTLDVVIERVRRRGCQHARLAHATAQHLAPAQRAGDQGARAAQRRADRRAQPLAEAHRDAVEIAGDVSRRGIGVQARFRRGDRGIEQARAVQVGGQAMRTGQAGRLRQIGECHRVTVPGVFQAQQAGTGKVDVVGLDRCSDVGQLHLAAGALRQRLRLDAAQHRRAAALKTVGVGKLADDVLVSALAMDQQRTQVALRARRHEKRGFLAGDVGDARLQGVDAGVVAKDVVAEWRSQHGGAHDRRRLRDGVAAQVNWFTHGLPREVSENWPAWRGHAR